MSPPLGKTSPPYSYIGHIYDNYERISIKMSESNSLTMLMSILGENILKYFTPFGGSPTPNILI